MTRKEKKRIQDIMEEVAWENGVSVEKVRCDIESFIAVSMQSPDPEVRARWREIPKKGEVPTPEEVILFFAKLGQGLVQ